ncbi:NADPH-dependent diflavin oxidoreductase 1 isoform X2 [Pan paniscus]|uniref:NADPH-dependent diflavin oxidoreductase 1 isoform X2 n=1 Tax=Pan paniscus TaxID=9597 RepID=UPI003006153B
MRLHAPAHTGSFFASRGPAAWHPGSCPGLGSPWRVEALPPPRVRPAWSVFSTRGRPSPGSTLRPGSTLPGSTLPGHHSPPRLQPRTSLTVSTGSTSWPRSCTDGYCSLGAAPSCPCAWAMTSMSWGESAGVAPASTVWSGHTRGPFRPAHVLPPRPDAAVDPWLRDLWDRVLGLYPPPPGLAEIPPGVPLPSKFTLLFLQEAPSTGSEGQRVAHPGSQEPPSESKPFLAPMISNQRVTGPSHFQDVRLIEFDILGSGISFAAGDVVLIQPSNSAAHVQRFCQVLGLDPDQLFMLQPREPDVSSPTRLPQPCSMRHLVSHYLDIASVPRRSFFELLACLSLHELEREKLLEFSSAQGQEELFEYCNRPRRTILEVLCDFPHTAAAIPPDYLLDLIPAIRPRAFSIASSLLIHPSRLQILVAVVQFQTRLKEPRRGLCSSWLASLDPGQGPVRVPLWVRPGSLAFPETPDTPVIMVGPGTGVAPFRAAIQERVAQGQTGNFLFFGCRWRDQDFYWESEWQELEKRECLTLIPAFSREQEQKVYVQHRLRELGSLVWELLDHQGAYFYLAGNAKSMPADVSEALMSIFQEEGGLCSPDAAAYLARLQQTRRFQTETWA